MKVPYISLLFSIVYIFSVILIGWKYGFFYDEKATHIRLNEIGDYCAGAFSPLAIFWFVKAFFQQSAEIAQNTQIAKDSFALQYANLSPILIKDTVDKTSGKMILKIKNIGNSIAKNIKINNTSGIQNVSPYLPETSVSKNSTFSVEIQDYTPTSLQVFYFIDFEYEDLSNTKIFKQIIFDTSIEDFKIQDI